MSAAKWRVFCFVLIVMSTSPPATSQSQIFDNRACGAAGDFLKRHIRSDSNLSFVSAYYTVHACAALKSHPESAARLRFLFGEPTSVTSLVVLNPAG
jgi:hypothetical protein